MGSPRYLFVYGTLLPHRAPAEIAPLLRHLPHIGQGSVRGRLYDLGEYPGAILSRSGKLISGEVLQLPPAKRVLSLLDAYEGFEAHRRKASLFVRERWPVTMSNGERLDCWVYVYNGQLETARLIRSGRYAPRRQIPSQTRISACADAAKV